MSTVAVTPKSMDPEVRDFLDKFDFSACMICGTCSNGCPITGTPGMEGWDTRKVMRMLSFGMVQEVVDSKFPWLCTNCGRCAYSCPMGIDIPAVMAHMKSLRPRDQVPGSLHQGAQNNLDTGNNLAISREEYLEGMADLGQEMAEECPGFYVPIDKKGADILFFPNSKEVYGDFEDQFWWWKVFYAAKEDWTVPSEGWEAVDWALFTGNYEGNRRLAKRKIDFMKEFEIKRMIMPDCGGGSYGCRKGMETCVMEDPNNEVGFIYLYDYLVQIIRDGRIKLDKSVNAGRRFTFHDSCKHCRELERHFGKGYYEEARWIMRQCVDDFVDMQPNRQLNYCCGAGGGMWPAPYDDESAWHGRHKYEQIRRSGADVVVVACSNCRDQIMKRIPKFFDGYQFEVKYLWQLVAEALVIEPWPEHMAQLARKNATTQWKELRIHLD